MQDGPVGWTPDRATALLELLARLSTAVERIADGLDDITWRDTKDSQDGLRVYGMNRLKF